ncbi:MAG: FAD-dependent oxidoreductase, partial [Chloroflexota bacterium]
MASQPFPELFQPGRIGEMTLRNRIVMPPMGTNFAEPDGSIGQRSIDYYEARARGGVGLVIVEVTGVELSRGKTIRRQIGIDDDKFVDGLSRLSEAIHRHGARSAIQIHHAGRLGHAVEPIAPSSVMLPPSHRTPREMTGGEIEEMIGRYAAGARRARLAGFDGVEIHGAHQYLISQFLSPATNRRQDQWGGTLKNRARFLVEITRAVRREVGSRYPTWCRLSAREYGLEGGIVPEEAEQVAQWAEEAGCDAISVSCYGVGNWAAVNMPHTPGALLPLIEGVKRMVTVPVMAVGRLGPALGCHILKEGKADLVCIGRALLTDADWPNKVAASRLQDIRPCIGCHKCLELAPEGILCTANPVLGREREMAIAPASRPKKVLVIGGGPAGLEAARVAALRGHQVTLWEKSKRLGGQLLGADKAP